MSPSPLENVIAAFHEIERVRPSGQPQGKIPPVARFAVTLTFLVTLVSFDKYDFPGVLGMTVYPLALALAEKIPVARGLRQLRHALLLVVLLGIANPFFDRAVAVRIGTVAISGGWLSFAVLFLKGVLALLAGWSLLRLTGVDGMARTFASLRFPPSFGFSILLMHRYLVIMAKETIRMRDAYTLRSGTRGSALKPSAWGPFAGLLLLRSIDRSNRVKDAMDLRGYSGAYRLPRPSDESTSAGWLYFVLWTGCFAAIRYCDPMLAIGKLALEIFK